METGRWTFPKTPFEERICLYCDSGKVDTELHCITECHLIESNRTSLYKILDGIDDRFLTLNNEQKLLYLLCPVNAQVAKLSNKYLGQIVKARDYMDQGKPIENIGIISLNENGVSLLGGK